MEVSIESQIVSSVKCNFDGTDLPKSAAGVDIPRYLNSIFFQFYLLHFLTKVPMDSGLFVSKIRGKIFVASDLWSCLT